jgi:hypothetical protein
MVGVEDGARKQRGGERMAGSLLSMKRKKNKSRGGG